MSFLTRFSHGLVLPVTMVALLLFALPATALAHERRTIAGGKYDVVVGWDVEPTYVNERNGAAIRISQAGSNPAVPVEGADKTLKVQIRQGAQTKEFALRAVFGQPGYYMADIVPTRAGDYVWTFVGTINADQVNETFDSADGKFDAAVPPTALQFPIALPDPVQAAASGQAAQSDAQTTRIFAYAGIGVGILGLIVGLAAWATRPRASVPAHGPVTVLLVLALALTVSTGSALAHAYPKTSDPTPNARLDGAPAHLGITFDSPIDPHGSSMVLMDSTGAVEPTNPDQVNGNTRTSISPATDLGPGPYTVAWTSLSSEDGHAAQGFYTFVVNGGPVGIVNGQAQSQAPAADLMATLTVTTAGDGGSLLRVDLSNTTGVERVRIRLSRPDLGEDLLDTHPSGDGGWVLDGNEVALPGNWQAVVIARRTNIFDDAMGTFGFTVDPGTGAPAFAAANGAAASN